MAWITGAGGLIGNCLAETAPQFAPSWQIRSLLRRELDLLDFAAVRREFLADAPGLIIHCAALSHPPTCEEHPGLAIKINVQVTLLLAELAQDIPMLFLSTDLVFDGQKGDYDETMAPHPLSRYAENKLAAEQAVLSNPKHTVIRTSLNGGTSPTGDRSFNERLRQAFQSGRTLRLFTDEFRCPVPVIITARAIWELVHLRQSGLFHVAGSERLSRWQMGQLVAARWPHLHPKIEPGSIREFPGAPRSPDTSLNCAKVQRLLSFSLPRLSNWLAGHPEEIF